MKLLPFAPINRAGRLMVAPKLWMKLQTGAFQFTFRNTPGLNFTALSSTNAVVQLDNWTSLGSATEVSPGHYQFTDATPEGQQQFYVVRSP